MLNDFEKYKLWCGFYGYNPIEAKSLKAYKKLKGLSISRVKEEKIYKKEENVVK